LPLPRRSFGSPRPQERQGAASYLLRNRSLRSLPQRAPQPSRPLPFPPRSLPVCHRAASPAEDFALSTRRTLETVHRVGLTVLLLLAVAGGCTSGNERAETNSPIRSGAATTDGLKSLSGQSQGATLRMASGRSTATFQVTALDPPTHVFDVRVAAPASADFRVRMRTSDGALLHILDSTRSADWCQVRRDRSVCFLPFPLLEARREGLWTVIVTKRSIPAAAVRVAVTFRSP
jgi:hypothetical protein